MRPIKLTLSAFGPYGGVETIDFREATDAGLFGIYGPTGSGKSSIFSAIAFALFGEGAKEEQGIGTMRSDFAPESLLTEVGLQFELGDKRYFVRRIPDQTRPKSRGEGQTMQAHTAWLFDVSEIAVDDVSPDCCGTPIAERKVSDVVRHIEELLGYGAQQFRQIVLLPQGRFERFLVSNSKDRLEILRELFDVSLYRRLTDKLKADAADVRREIEDGYRLNGQRLRSKGFDSSDELGSGIASALERCELSRLTVAKTMAALNAANSAFAAAEAQEKLFGEVDAADAALKELEGKVAEFETVRGRKSRAELARRMADLESNLADARTRHAAAETSLANAAGEAKRARDASLEAKAKLDDLRSREHELESLARKVDELGRHKQVLIDSSERHRQHEIALSALNVAKQAYDQAISDHQKAEQAFDEKFDSHAVTQRNTVEQQRLIREREKLKLELDSANAHLRASEAAEQAQADFDAASTAALDAQARHRSAEEGEAAREHEFISAQASILAERLEDGLPCPVCGASDHPQPAHGSGDAALLEKAWRDAQSASIAAAKLDRDAQSRVSSASATLEARRATVSDLPEPRRGIDEIDTEYRLAVGAIEELGEIADVTLLAKQVEELRERKLTTSTKLQQANSALSNATTAEAVARQAYTDRIASVPEELQDPVALQAAIEAATVEIDQRKKAIAGAIEEQQIAHAAQIKAEATEQSAQVSLKDCAEDIVKKQAGFEKRLVELDISETVYRSAIPDIELIGELEEAIAKFDKELAGAQGRQSAAMNAVGSAQRPVMEPFRLNCVQTQTAADEAARNSADAQQKHQSLVELQTSLADELKNLQNLEQTSGSLRGLAEAFDGQNELRTTLETFAIGAMFDQVLEAANLRLDPMTGGRYRFERDTVSVSGRSKRGLDVRVHDIETGRAREIITLSGGETFIAALSLALGLSDIVEMTNGAIRLDTIFIDEGFGSLDTENDAGTLDQVLQVLQNIVGERRAVGLISHVPLVQQAVPNGFTVHKGVNGSQIEARVG
ncbi:AAA family ATPase [Novosphingobium sp. KN65.2]|uniref:AAA family ATPase n=1 Tax=Novosphingobium sp. KN65.2 TaxID=1478134 RepID=UPI0005E24B4C|nr:SMC family ATPase [Novosphingobium sp. KN65.2]CDO39015.1 putative Exonuclease protein [Novosphingobium sp. KN65.2]